MPNPLKGPCPHCGAEILIRVSVSKALVTGPADEEQPHPQAAPTNGSRPACEECGAPGAILEQVVKKPGPNQGRLFTAYTCSNEGCPSYSDTIGGTFRWTGGRREPAQA